MFMSYKDFENEGVEYTNNYKNNLINALQHLSKDKDISELYDDVTIIGEIDNFKSIDESIIHYEKIDKFCDYDEKHTHCTCGKSIINVYEAIHIPTKTKLLIGSSCYNHFLDINNKTESEKKQIKRKILKKDHVYCIICSQKPKILKDKQYHKKCKLELDSIKDNTEKYYLKLSKCKLRFCNDTFNDTFEELYSKYRYIDWLIKQRRRKYEPFNLFKDYCKYRKSLIT
jgi:hypothetical protein